MKLEIRFLSALKSIVKSDRFIIEIDSKTLTLQGLINKLKNKLGQNFIDLIINKESASINPDILIFIEEKEIRSLQELDTPLFDGNKIVFLSSIHGGYKT
ncbi:MAG: hypothetical protein ACTSQI_06285 [Candidatus Helarchaeota archaeon]